jgi:hypothetical protein
LGYAESWKNPDYCHCKTEKDLCNNILFPSVIQVTRDSIRKSDALGIVVRYHKKDGDISVILQIEFD